jgi:hypothetical protein
VPGQRPSLGAASFSPFVVLLSQDGADEADQGVAAGKILTTSVRRRISRLSRSWVILSREGGRGCDLGCFFEDSVFDEAG